MRYECWSALSEPSYFEFLPFFLIFLNAFGRETFVEWKCEKVGSMERILFLPLSLPLRKELLCIFSSLLLRNSVPLRIQDEFHYYLLLAERAVLSLVNKRSGQLAFLMQMRHARRLAIWVSDRFLLSPKPAQQ